MSKYRAAEGTYKMLLCKGFCKTIEGEFEITQHATALFLEDENQGLAIPFHSVLAMWKEKPKS